MRASNRRHRWFAFVLRAHANLRPVARPSANSVIAGSPRRGNRNGAHLVIARNEAIQGVCMRARNRLPRLARNDGSSAIAWSLRRGNRNGGPGVIAMTKLARLF